uniref:Uncharacterized protein n=1 Tax=Aegilops tauschii subsp. strangulata TaxID=200361 RepID=A0A453D0R2_AEGTS
DFPAAMGETEITSGSKEHSNTANSDQHICKEPSGNVLFYCYLVDALNSYPELILWV